MAEVKNKKIGILTYHNCFNYGAFLQAYALQKYLKNIGCDNVIIDYKNIIHWFREYKVFLWSRNLKVIQSNIEKILNFKKAWQYLKLSKLFLKKFDTIIVGSDTVWDFNDKMTHTGKKYFGYNLKTENLVAYSASFGFVDKNSLIPNFVVTGLKKFNKISVRDENSFEIINSLINKNAPITVDPIFLNDNYEQLESCPYENFILIYSSKLDKTNIEEIIQYAKEKNKIIISVGFYHNWCQINKITIGPFEWLEYMRQADFIITNMFHGALFSIKFNKNFVLFVTPRKANKYNPILQKLNLTDRIANQENNIKNIFLTQINYEIVNQKLIILIKESQEYLKNALGAK